MQRCCKCGGVLWILPCQIIKWVQFKDSKWSRHKIETFFLGARDFFGPLNGTSDSKGHGWHPEMYAMAGMELVPVPVPVQGKIEPTIRQAWLLCLL